MAPTVCSIGVPAQLLETLHSWKLQTLGDVEAWRLVPVVRNYPQHPMSFLSPLIASLVTSNAPIEMRLCLNVQQEQEQEQEQEVAVKEQGSKEGLGLNDIALLGNPKQIICCRDHLGAGKS